MDKKIIAKWMVWKSPTLNVQSFSQSGGAEVNKDLTFVAQLSMLFFQRMQETEKEIWVNFEPQRREHPDSNRWIRICRGEQLLQMEL